MNRQKPVQVHQYYPGAPPAYGDYAGAQPPAVYGADPYGMYFPAAPKSPNPLANLKFQDIKAWIDRMGGIDGILNTLNKVQRVMQTMQQFAPMLRLLIPRANSAGADPDDEEYKPRRRRRRRRRPVRRSGYRRSGGWPAGRKAGAARRAGGKTAAHRRRYGVR